MLFRCAPGDKMSIRIDKGAGGDKGVGGAGQGVATCWLELPARLASHVTRAALLLGPTGEVLGARGQIAG